MNSPCGLCVFRVTVTFNVNNSIPANFEEEEEEHEQTQKSAEEEVSLQDPIGMR